jgi:hypothetical protein
MFIDSKKKGTRMEVLYRMMLRHTYERGNDETKSRVHIMMLSGVGFPFLRSRAVLLLYYNCRYVWAPCER